MHSRHYVSLVFVLFTAGALAVTDSRALECPDKPSCVSSRSENPDRRVPPLDYEGDAGNAIGRLVTIIEQMPRSAIVSTTDRSVHATFTSRVFGFVDDVSLVVNDAGTIDVCSVSRVGYYDFGVNRSRIERIRARFEA